MENMIAYQEVAKKTFLLGSFSVGEDETINSYLLQLDKANVIINLVSPNQYQVFKTAIEKCLPLTSVTHLVIASSSFTQAYVIKKFVEDGFDGIIITNAFHMRQINSLGFDVKTMSIEAINHKLKVSQNEVLSFIPMTFLPEPEMFMVYVPSHKILFSSTLFSNVCQHNSSITIENLFQDIIKFHKLNMPSSEFIKSPLRAIRSLDIDAILPLFGHLILGNMVPNIIKHVNKLEFFNTYQVVKKTSGETKQYNYLEIINHMLLHLHKNFSLIDILDTFIGSPYVLQPEPLEIVRSSYDGYKLWNGFFEYVYAKRGIHWLSILEPLVNKYVRSFNIKKPVILRSKVLELTINTQMLDQKRQNLEADLVKLDAVVEETKQQMMRCPITKLFHQDFFREMLRNDFNNPLTDNLTRGFLLVQIDQLNTINTKFGKETGDETIRNLSYLMEQAKKNDAMLFKQNGPGIFIYENNTTFPTVQKCAVNIRNTVQDSNLFIENITVSISIVTYDEIDQKLSIDDQIKHMIALLETRMMFAKQKGLGEIIDRSFQMPKPSEGVILLIDEDEINRNMIYRIFKRVNYEVIVAKDVHDALDMIAKHNIDVIISEINLSKIDGFTLKQILNETKEHKNIPFIMVSHNKKLDNIKRGNTLDVDLILEKPIIPEELFGHVKRFKDRMKHT
ncbi:MAG: response regulator [Acholeplasmataceae bacterium]|nr:response regulator [Acholeplasmataceae bacterium]